MNKLYWHLLTPYLIVTRSRRTTFCWYFASGHRDWLPIWNGRKAAALRQIPVRNQADDLTAAGITLSWFTPKLFYNAVSSAQVTLYSTEWVVNIVIRQTFRRRQSWPIWRYCPGSRWRKVRKTTRNLGTAGPSLDSSVRVRIIPWEGRTVNVRCLHYHKKRGHVPCIWETRACTHVAGWKSRGKKRLDRITLKLILEKCTAKKWRSSC
jgi:hypothetical protein